MSVDDYAQKVLHYVRNPEAKPQLELMSDEEAREAGMPSPAECVSFLGAVVTEEMAKEKANFAGFDDEEKSAISATGSNTVRKKAPRMGEQKGAVTAEETDAGRVMKDQAQHAKRMAMQERRKPTKKRGERDQDW